MRIYTITYFEPDDETEGTVEEALIALQNGDLTVDDLDTLAKIGDSSITVEYSVVDKKEN